MTITLYLKPDQEELLRVIAQTSGVSIEGYLLTLIESVVDPKPTAAAKGISGAVQRLRNPAPSGSQSRAQADDAVHQMRANVLAHQEKAVEAVTKVNLLRATTEQQQRKIAHAELRALTLARDGDSEQALRAYQESCIYGRNLQTARNLLEEAARIADELLAVFRQQEANMKARLSDPHRTALATLQNLNAKSELTGAEMVQRITQEATPDQWRQQYAAWVTGMTRPDPKANMDGETELDIEAL